MCEGADMSAVFSAIVRKTVLDGIPGVYHGADKWVECCLSIYLKKVYGLVFRFRFLVGAVLEAV